MVGLVLVSHSRPLADALVALVRQVSAQQIPIAIAAGVGPERQEFGTDAVEIAEAIQRVFSPDGVVVLMDLGSAILSAQTALDLLPEETRARVHFCSAPLVEGAIAAAVQIGLGSDAGTVCQEAQQALAPKRQQVGDGALEAAPTGSSEPKPSGAEHQVVLTLENEHGLHARPAARFVRTASRFRAEVRVKNLTTGTGPVSARSLNALATLGAVKGHRLQILASGPEAPAALRALQDLVRRGFEEVAPLAEASAATAAGSSPLPEGSIEVVPLSEGVAVGPATVLRAPRPQVPDEPAADLDWEWARLQAALQQVQEEVRARHQEVLARLGEAQAAIFEAHLLILQDPELLEKVHRKIRAEHLNAAAAWQVSVEETVAAYHALDDPYLQQRAQDVADVGEQVLRALTGEAPPRWEFPRPVVLVAEDLTPTQTARLDPAQVLGLVTVFGGPTSHAAILARGLGIPAVTGAPPSLLRLPEDSTLGLDGSRGILWLNPTPQEQTRLRAARAGWLAERSRLLEASRRPAATRDGVRIEVAANVGGLADARAARHNGAEAVGLLRTEFLFLTRRQPPTEEEQIQALTKIAEVMEGCPIIVRTLDAGGDKPLPYLEQSREANPFLGIRGLRWSLQHQDLFLPQLRAILRAAAGHDFRVMFPMVTQPEEVRQALGLLEAAHHDLETEGLPHAWPVDVGIMVEVPAAALTAEAFAPLIDFFSVGTNDLTQYTLAAERGHPSLTDLSDALSPAVLRLVQQTVKAADRHGKWVGVCGELAGDPAGAVVLVGLGVRELSLNPAGIPRIKATLRGVDLPAAQDLAGRVLQASSAAEARRIAEAAITPRD